MSDKRHVKKSERLLQIEALLLAHPDGLTQAEMARRLGVHRSTITHDMRDWPRHIPIYEEDDRRVRIDREHYLVNVRLTLHEAMAMHLAARLMATRSDKQNPHAAAALRKLGLSLEKLAPRISEHLKQSAEVMEDEAQRHDPCFLGVMETLTTAWAEGKRVRLWHRHEATRRIFEYTFEPYFVEPYAVGQTTHVIGRRTPPGAPRTLKVERIERAELLDEPYTIPDDFDPRTLLADAWGIWYSDKEPEKIVLRFHSRVAARVLETRWHRSEDSKLQPDGSLLWWARVAEPQEMLPWIRGWGADVEVLEPKPIREQMMGEVRALARHYGIEAKAERDIFDDFFGG